MITPHRHDDCTLILQYYSAIGVDERGRTVDDVLAFTTDELEDVHDYIQWLFPLDTRSMFNTTAPVLAPWCGAAFRDDDARVARLHRALDVMLAFYGFTREGDAIARSPEHERRVRAWVTPGNHNFLRLTRILRSLTLLGETGRATRFLAALEDVYVQHAPIIGATTLAHWRRAVAP